MPAFRSRLQRRLVRYGAALVVVATAAACSASGSGSSPQAAAPLQFGVCCSWGATWSYNPYTAFFPGFGDDFVLQTLAMQNPPTLTDFIPQLADKWTTSGRRITVHLRAGAKWQDGKAVSSTDLLDTILLNGTNGDPLWNDITDVAAPSGSEVTVTVRNSIPTAQALTDLLATRPVPASVYGTMVPANLKQQLVSYYNQQATDPAAADRSPAKTAMTKVFTGLSKFSPKTLVGDGPYKLESMNSQQAKLARSGAYYNADKIKVAEIDYIGGEQTTQLYGTLTSQQLDFSNLYLPAPIAQKFTHTPNSQVALPPSFSHAILFNCLHYPLSITKVRQALAYLIPRKDMAAAAYGTTDAGGVAAGHTDGLTPAVEKVWLTKAQSDSLNPYNLDPGKATALLQEAGFHQAGKQWIMPNGKPFTLDMESNAETTNVVLSFKTAASALTNFGIKTDVTAVPGAKQTADLHSGDFQITAGTPNSLNPLAEIDQILGSTNNFSTLGNYKGQKGIGYGPEVDVPDLGRVNVAQTIDHQVRTVAPGADMKKLTWTWARLVNQDVPYLQYDNKVYQFAFTTTHYTKWPGVKDSIWDLVQYNLNGGFVHAEEAGFIQPR
ncbi:MAG TPA: ABC transporter substrate-binding protein [Mycobacteriales bacterium]|jgi:peptide/nickel transport system substrate-binding protein|nr:ABC transporter substrate-binding protein [Mycobacteriales bacterium]